MDILEVLITALVFGLLGSFHCAGMCGPIALALPLSGKPVSRLAGGIMYNLGRSVTYGILGALFGLFGQGLAFSGLHRWVSISMGTIMVLSVVIPLILNLGKKELTFPFLGKLQSYLGSLLGKGAKTPLFVVGVLNGLLPCGLVYMAIAGAIATGSVIKGSLFMLVFGLGTLPMLLLISYLGSLITSRLRNIFSKVIPIMVVIIGLLFILRGLSLGIPYISPPEKAMEIETAGSDCCHASHH